MVWHKGMFRVLKEQQNNSIFTMKHGGGSVMFYCCSSTARTFSAISVQKILTSGSKLKMKRNFTFYHYSDPTHKPTKIYLIQNKINVSEWPRQGSLLSQIYHKIIRPKPCDKMCCHRSGPKTKETVQ